MKPGTRLRSGLGFTLIELLVVISIIAILVGMLSVVTFNSVASKPGERKIAYLEQYEPPLKELLERVKAARATRRSNSERFPRRESEFVNDNTLVRRVGEREWYRTSSSEGR